MKCSEFHPVAAAYALDALSEEERIACLRHLRDEGPHEHCEALLERYERVVDELAKTVAPAPVAPSLWRAIELRLGLHRSTSTPSTPRAEPTEGRQRRWRESLAWAAVAAALLGALWSHQTSQLRVQRAERERSRSEQTLTNTSAELAGVEAARRECSAALATLSQRRELGRDAVSLLEDPATKIAPMSPAGTQAYKATALYNAKTKRAVVISSSVQPVAGKDYELWVIAAGKPPMPAGFLRFDASGVSIGEFDAGLLAGPAPAALAVSLEPAGGRPTPTEVVLMAKLSG
jgi:anti-sigma-K factor RskA